MSLLDALLLDEYRDPREVWIAARADGLKGSGSHRDPLSGMSIPYPAIEIGTLTGDLSDPNEKKPWATAVMNVNHGFSSGDLVTISGVDIQFSNQEDIHYVGTFPITKLSDTSFKYQMIGRANSGTATPMPGNIQCWREREQFDVAMRSVGPNSVIHIGEGTFETKGYNPFISGGWNVKSGQRIVGSSMGSTILKIVNTAGVHSSGGQTHAIAFPDDPDINQDGLEVSDLTVDCNVDGQLHPSPSCSAIGVYFGGRHLRIRRVRAIHFGSLGPIGSPFALPSPYNENFPFIMGGSDCVDARFEDCVAEFPSPNVAWNSTVFNLHGGWDTMKMYYSRGTVLRHNYVNCEYVYGPMAWIQGPIQVTPDSNGYLVRLTTRTPHGYSVPGNVSVQGVRVGGSLENQFNGVFKIESPIPSPTQLTYYAYGDPGAADAPDCNTLVGAPVSPQPVMGTLPNGQQNRRVFRVTTPIPHNLTVNNRVYIGGVVLNGYKDAPENPCNGFFPITTVLSKTQFEYTADQPSSVDPGANGYSFGGSDPIVGSTGHAMMSADNGTGAIVEGNRLLHGGTGGPWKDTASTQDIIARFNYYHDVNAGPTVNGGDIQTFAPRPVQSLSHGGPANRTATCLVDSGQTEGLVVGQVVGIDGARVHGNTQPYSGYQIIQSLSASAFTYILAYDPGADPDTGTQIVFTPVAQTGRRTLERNIIELALGRYQNYWSNPTAIYMAVANKDLKDVIPYTERRALVRRNIIRQADWKKDDSHTGITVRNTEKYLADSNVLEVGYPNPLGFRKCVAASFFNNTDPAGALIRGHDEDTGQNASELLSLIEDALTLAL